MAKHELKPHHEVQDTETWGIFHHLFEDPVEFSLPVIDLGFYQLHITKFMLLELLAAGLILLIFVPLARRIQTGGLPTGRFWNLFEFMLVFVRDQIARPNIGGHADHGHADHGHDHGGHAAHHKEDVHPADKYVPFLWTVFLFILFCNLLGMFPLLGSPTASIWMTGGMALISFLMMHGVVIYQHGLARYWKSLWPKIDMPPGAVFQVMGLVFTILIGLIEIMGTFIKSGVLAVRLFANMFAGHLVLATILWFIYAVGTAFGTKMLWGTVTLASVFGVVAAGLLEAVRPGSSRRTSSPS
ncbi:MAG: F0F1 ATP synthase subunit A [Gemmataceae bacterium]